MRGKHAAPTPSFRRNNRTVIAANHVHALDPFAIVSSLYYKDFFRLAPFSFMVANVFFRMVWLRPLLWLAGCFPAKPLDNSHQLTGVEASLGFLDQGYTVFIFPEGKRVKNEPIPAKRGVAMILEQSPSSQLVIARIIWKERRVESVRLANKNDDHDNPQKILDAIHRL